jgi:hypothetical protein
MTIKELINITREKLTDIPFIVIIEENCKDGKNISEAYNNIFFLPKPFSCSNLASAIQKASTITA